MNLQTIANAIATTLGTVTATNGTVSESVTASADLPNQVTQLALLVYPPTGSLNIVMGPHLDDSYDFEVRLLRDPLSMPGRTQWLYAWFTALRPLIQTHVSLGVAGVTQAQAVGARLEIEGVRYASPANTPGGDLFDLVELTIRVQVFELASGLAP